MSRGRRVVNFSNDFATGERAVAVFAAVAAAWRWQRASEAEDKSRDIDGWVTIKGGRHPVQVKHQRPDTRDAFFVAETRYQDGRIVPSGVEKTDATLLVFVFPEVGVLIMPLLYIRRKVLELPLVESGVQGRAARLWRDGGVNRSTRPPFEEWVEWGHVVSLEFLRREFYAAVEWYAWQAAWVKTATSLTPTQQVALFEVN